MVEPFTEAQPKNQVIVVWTLSGMPPDFSSYAEHRDKTSAGILGLCWCIQSLSTLGFTSTETIKAY